MPGIESFGQLQPQPQPLNLQPTQQLPFAEPSIEAAKRPLDIQFRRPLEILRDPSLQYDKPLSAPSVAPSFSALLPKGLVLGAALLEGGERLDQQLNTPTELKPQFQDLSDLVAAGNLLQEGAIAAPFLGGQEAGILYYFIVLTTSQGVELSEYNGRVIYCRGKVTEIFKTPINGYTDRWTVIDLGGTREYSETFGWVNPGSTRRTELRRVDQQPDTAGNIGGMPSESADPVRDTNPARTQRTPAPITTPSIKDSPFAEPEAKPRWYAEPDPVADLTPDEVGDMLVPRVNPLTGERDLTKPPVPLWDLPDDEWLVSPPYFPNLSTGSNNDPKSPYRKYPAIVNLQGPQFIPIKEMIPDIKIPTYPDKPDDCCGGGDCDLSPVIELLSTPINGQITLQPCGSGDNTSYSSDGQGMEGLSEKLGILAEAMVQIWDKVKCENDAALAIPETWNLKRSIAIDQMIIVTKKPDDRTSYRRSFTIPHPRYKKLSEVSRIKRFTYKRGSCQATIILSDNSCCVLNCSTMAEAKRVIKYVLQLIEPSWAREAKVNFTEKINMAIQPATVEFHRAEYFLTTDDRILPDWAINIP